MIDLCIIAFDATVFLNPTYDTMELNMFPGPPPTLKTVMAFLLFCFCGAEPGYDDHDDDEDDDDDDDGDDDDDDDDQAKELRRVSMRGHVSQFAM